MLYAYGAIGDEEWKGEMERRQTEALVEVEVLLRLDK